MPGSHGMASLRLQSSLRSEREVMSRLSMGDLYSAISRMTIGAGRSDRSRPFGAAWLILMMTVIDFFPVAGGRGVVLGLGMLTAIVIIVVGAGVISLAALAFVVACERLVALIAKRI